MDSSFCEKPERHASRRLSDDLTFEGQKQLATKPTNVAAHSLRRATCLVGRISRILFCANCF